MPAARRELQPNRIDIGGKCRFRNAVGTHEGRHQFSRQAAYIDDAAAVGPAGFEVQVGEGPRDLHSGQQVGIQPRAEFVNARVEDQSAPRAAHAEK